MLHWHSLSTRNLESTTAYSRKNTAIAAKRLHWPANHAEDFTDRTAEHRHPGSFVDASRSRPRCNLGTKSLAITRTAPASKR
jgi:hypothetical protein